MKNLFKHAPNFLSFLNQFFVILLLFIFNNRAIFAANVTTPIGTDQTVSLSSVADIASFTGNNAKLNIDIDKTLYSISSSAGTALNGVGSINFNTPGKTLTINNSIGSSSAIIKDIIFNNDATLEVKDDIYALNIINATNNNIGTLNFNGLGTVQIISAKIGDENHRIQNINVNTTSATGTRFYENVFVENLTASGVVNISANKTFDASGNLSGSGKIKGSSSNVGSLNLSGTTPQFVDITIGSSPTIKLSSVKINNTSDDGVIFSKDIFTNEFDVGANTTLSGFGTSDLGIVKVAANKKISFARDNITMNSIENYGSINIHSGRIINIAKDTALFGTVNIGVDYDLSGSSIAGQIKALGDIDIADDLKINFDFSNINQQSDENLYPILTVAPNKNLNIADISQIMVSDNSILMDVSLRLSSDHKQLLAFNGVNHGALSLLGNDDSKIAQNILNINAANGSSLKLVQNQLLRISDLNILKKSLNSLQAPSNNMIAASANNLNDKANNIIISHLFLAEEKNNKNNIWGQAFNSKASWGSKENQEGYDSDMIGFVFGKDFIIKNSKIYNLIGAAATYSKANVDSKSGTKADINSFGIILYNHLSKKNNEGLYNNNLINFAHNKYQQSRLIKAGTFSATPKSSFSGMQYGLRTLFGYNFKLSNTIISPNIALKYSRIAGNSYTEKGAGDVGLKIKNQPFDNLSSEIGAKITYNNKLDDEFTALPAFNFGWIRNLKTKGQKSTSSFIAGGEEIRSDGIAQEKNIFALGFEISLLNNNNFLLTFKHDIQGGCGFKSKTSYLKYRQFF